MTALRQSNLNVNEQAVSSSTVTLACVVFQRHASKLTAKNECLKQLDKELIEKQSLLLRNVVKSLKNSI